MADSVDQRDFRQRQILGHRVASVLFVALAIVFLIPEQLGVTRAVATDVGLMPGVGLCLSLSIFNLVKSWQFDRQFRRSATAGPMPDGSIQQTRSAGR